MAQPLPEPNTPLESAEEQARHTTWLTARIAEADADFAAGRYIDGDEADAWLQRELAEAKGAFDREPD